MPDAPPTVEDELKIGLQRLREHMLNLAELIFERVVAKAPGNVEALHLLGVSKHKLGDSAAALTRRSVGGGRRRRLDAARDVADRQPR